MLGKFIMVDGPDFSGKTSCINNLKKKLDNYLDVDLYEKSTGDFPSVDFLKNFKIIFCSEPNYSGLGRDLRLKLKKEKCTVDDFVCAREEHYQKVILPALNLGITIIQSRGVPSSIIYQGLLENNLNEVLNKNSFFLNVFIDKLIILSTSEFSILEKRKLSRDQHDLYEDKSYLRQIWDFYSGIDFTRMVNCTQLNFKNDNLDDQGILVEYLEKLIKLS